MNIRQKYNFGQCLVIFIEYFKKIFTSGEARSQPSPIMGRGTRSAERTAFVPCKKVANNFENHVTKTHNVGRILFALQKSIFSPRVLSTAVALCLTDEDLKAGEET